MTEAIPVTLTGQEMFQIRQTALSFAIGARQPEDQTAKLLYDASAYLNFLLNGLPSDETAGYITAPKPNTPEILAAAGGAITETPKAKRAPKAAAPSATPVIQATAPVVAAVQAADTAPAAALTTIAPSPSIVPAPTTLQATADSLKALVQDDSRGGRVAAVALLAKFGVAQLNQIPAAKLAEFKAALDSAGLGAPAAAASPGSDLL